MINLNGLIWFSIECRIWLLSNVQLDAKIWEMEAESGVKFNDGNIIWTRNDYEWLNKGGMT